MKNEVNMVTDFHKRIGATISADFQMLPSHHPTLRLLAERLRNLHQEFKSNLQDNDLLTRRVLMSLEEMAEWIEAHEKEDAVAAMDAWGDRCYLLLGDAVSSGIPVESVFAAVHESNMTKRGLDPDTGKAIKGQDYAEPRIKSAK